MKIDFVSFEKIVDEKVMGIATVDVDEKFRFKYKVMKNKEGNGFYFLAPTVKVGDDYQPAFLFDSNFLKQSVDNVLRDHVKRHFEVEVPF